MTVLLAVAVVGAGSLLFRLAPLLGADRIPEQATRLAAWAGLSVLAAITVRTVLHHRDASVTGSLPGGVPVAPLVAAAAVGVCLVLAARGRSLLLGVAAGAALYLALTALVAGG